jgi:hypothetical protein
VRRRARATVLLVAGVLVATACTDAGDRPTVQESSRSLELSRDAACTQAVTDVVSVTQRFVDRYAEADLASTPSPAPSSATGSPSVPSTATDVDLQAAVERAQEVRREQRCDDEQFGEQLQSGLDDVVAGGAVAAAVLRQVRANLTGRVAAEPVTRSVSPSDDLAEVLAEVGTGATVELAAGKYRLDESLVVLRGVVLRGAGQGRTALVSSAAEAAVLVLTSDRTELHDLEVRRTAGSSGSGLVGGSAASVLLDGVTVSGARIGEGAGGAGVLMTSVAGERPREGTTLEVTDSRFAGNEGAGIALGGDHRASIVSSTFTRNGQCGVCFLDDSGGAVRRSAFSANGAAVAVNARSAPLVERNRITGGEVGVQAVGDSAPVLRGNRITGAARAAVIWSGRAAGRADGTRCADVDFGLVVGPRAHPFLGDNDCPVAQGR